MWKPRIPLEKWSANDGFLTSMLVYKRATYQQNPGGRWSCWFLPWRMCIFCNDWRNTTQLLLCITSNLRMNQPAFGFRSRKFRGGSRTSGSFPGSQAINEWQSTASLLRGSSGRVQDPGSLLNPVSGAAGCEVDDSYSWPGSKEMNRWRNTWIFPTKGKPQKGQVWAIKITTNHH